MEISLAFHMIFAAIGIGMPLLMLMAEGIWLRTGKEVYLLMAKKWAKVTGLLFAIGAVSGTALSFELGLLWPKFMAFAGGIMGAAFALEGYAFFIEAIFLGLYLYGWDRLSPKAHWLCGLVVAISGAMSGILVLSANSWMQHPTGFDLGPDGMPTNVDPIAALFNPGWFVFAMHSTIATYIATSFAVAAVYASGMLRGRRDEYHMGALKLAMTVGAITALIQPAAGHLNAGFTTKYQPTKLAAMEAHFETERGAGLSIGGWPDVENRELKYAITLPKLLSIMASNGDPNYEVKGLNDFPVEDWPNIYVVRNAFQLMVGLGFTLIGISMWYWASRRWKMLDNRLLLLALVASGFMGFTALEAGWFVTEVGRQPWVIYGIMRTEDAVTPAPNVVETLIGFTALYILLTVTLIGILLRMRTGTPYTKGEVEKQSEDTGGTQVAPA